MHFNLKLCCLIIVFWCLIIEAAQNMYMVKHVLGKFILNFLEQPQNLGCETTGVLNTFTQLQTLTAIKHVFGFLQLPGKLLSVNTLSVSIKL